MALKTRVPKKGLIYFSFAIPAKAGDIITIRMIENRQPNFEVTLRMQNERHGPIGLEAGTISTEELGEGPISVYSGNASIITRTRLPAEVELSGEQPLHAAVQACNNHGRCLAPASIERPVPAVEKPPPAQ